MNWSYTAEFPEYLVLSIDVYSHGGNLIDSMCITGSYAHDQIPSCGLVVSSTNAGSRVNGGPGSFFVKVQAVNLNWTITVEDYY